MGINILSGWGLGALLSSSRFVEVHNYNLIINHLYNNCVVHLHSVMSCLTRWF